MGYLSIRKYAILRGCSAMAVSRAIRDGRLVMSVSRDENGKPNGVDPDIADVEWMRNTDHSKVPINQPTKKPHAEPIPEPVAVREPPPARQPPRTAPIRGASSAAAPTRSRPSPPAGASREPPDPDNPASQFARYRAESERYKAELQRLEFEKAIGKLVDAEDVSKTLVKMVSDAKTRMLALPSQAKQQIPHLSKDDVLLLEDMIRQALEELGNWQPPQTLSAE